MLDRKDRAVLGSTHSLVKKLQASPKLEEFSDPELEWLLEVENMSQRAGKSELETVARSVDVTPAGLVLLQQAAKRARARGFLDVPNNITDWDE